jgi:hypothetical protein
MRTRPGREEQLYPSCRRHETRAWGRFPDAGGRRSAAECCCPLSVRKTHSGPLQAFGKDDSTCVWSAPLDEERKKRDP